MATELLVVGAGIGSTVYAVATRDSDELAADQVADAAAAIVVADWADYAIAMPETPAASNRFVAGLPAWMVGTRWNVTYYSQAGAAPAATDTVLGGEVISESGRVTTIPAGDAGALGAYLDLAAAADLAASLPAGLLASWTAAEDEDKTAALVAASIEVDGAMRYQGSKYDPDQVREFPRWPHENPGCTSGALVWDWDEDADAAVVPADVLLAVLWQAESILRGDREERLDARHDGVSSQGADGLQESYSGEERALCRRAWKLMERYRLRSGRLL